MGKLVDNAVLDAALSYIKNNAVKMTACEGAPTTYEHANSEKGTGTGKALADVTMGTGDFVIADGTSGRKVTLDQKADVTIDVTGDADHVALIDTSEEVLLYVTTCTQQTLTADNTVTFPEWVISIADPT
jgi:hypothetical protein